MSNAATKTVTYIWSRLKLTNKPALQLQGLSEARSQKHNNLYTLYFRDWQQSLPRLHPHSISSTIQKRTIEPIGLETTKTEIISSNHPLVNTMPIKPCHSASQCGLQLLCMHCNTVLTPTTQGLLGAHLLAAYSARSICINGEEKNITFLGQPALGKALHATMGNALLTSAPGSQERSEWLGINGKNEEIKFASLPTFSKGNYEFPTKPNAGSAGIILVFIVLFAQIKHLSRSAIRRIFNIPALHYGEQEVFIEALLVRLLAFSPPR